MRVVGVVLLMLGAISTGMLASVQLKYRVAVLRSLKESLAYIERELAFRLTPITELMKQLGKDGPMPAKILFARCYSSLISGKELQFQDHWIQSIEQEEMLSLCDKGAVVIREIGGVLGRYDYKDQCKALKEAQNELSECLQRAESECQRLGKMYTTLGFGAGAMLVILLL